MGQLNYIVKLGSYNITPMIKIDTYDIIPNARQDLDSYRDANGVLKRNTLSHTASQINFTIRARTIAEHEAMMKAIKSNYSNYNERKLSVSYYDPEDCTYKTGDFYIDSNLKFHMYSNAKGVPAFGESEMALVEY